MRLHRAFRGVLAILCLFWVGAVLAQDAPPSDDDFETWDRFAASVETRLENPSAVSDSQLEAMRVDVARWRERFAAPPTTDDLRIKTVQEQIAALGPTPAEGEAEPEDIAARRAELNALLAELRAPLLKTEEAFNRANGLIAEIDALIRARATETLTQLGPSPLNPVIWPQAASEIGALGIRMWTDTAAALGPDAIEGIGPQNLALSAFFLLLALVLLVRGRGLMQGATEALARRLHGSGRGVGVFIVSLGQVAVPILGIYALMKAVDSLGILGVQGQVLVKTFPVIGLSVFGGRWLGQRLFPESPAEIAALAMSARARAEGRTHAAILGFLLGLNILQMRVSAIADFSPGTHALLAFPALALGGLVILRIGLILTKEVGLRGDEGDAPKFVNYLAASLGRVTIVLGLAGGVLAAVGYLNAGQAVIIPTILSVALTGLLTILFALIRDVYGLLRGRTQEEADQSLVPVLISFLLALATLPVFALIWGARTTDLAEIWTRFREGVAIGETQLRPGDFFTFFVVFALGYALTRSLQALLRSAVLPKTRMDIGGQNAIRAGVGYVGIFLAALVAITSAGIDLSNLAIVAGALSVGIGFGLQNVVSNFVSGIILLVERPIGQGDWIEVGGQMGIVKDISVRSTRIETFDRTDVIVPNADLVSGTVTNWTRGNLTGRITVSVGVAYSADSRRVADILYEICEAHPMVTLDPEPKIRFRRFGADALEFDCFCILRDVNYKLEVHSELNHQIHERFRAEGIEIPFAQRDLWLRNPEVLQHPPPPPGPKPEPKPPAGRPEADTATPGDSPNGTSETQAGAGPDTPKDRVRTADARDDT